MAEDAGEKRAPGGVRLRRHIDVVVEEPRSFTLFRAAIVDLSATGMRLMSDQYLAKGTRYTFTMKKPPFLAVCGEVRWIRSAERDTFRCGVRFVDMRPEDGRRLLMFLDLERKRVPSTAADT